jgi:hypothetical protein
MGMKKMYLLYIFPPELHTHLWLRCSNFFNPSKKNSFVCAANRKSQRLISTPRYKVWNWHSGWWSPIYPLGTATTNRPIVPAPGDCDDGEIVGMIGRRNGSTRNKTAPVPLCLPQTTHATRTWTRAAVVGSQRLTAWATARSTYDVLIKIEYS